MRGSRILLTGSTSGIGRALAGELARDGADLVLAGREREELERVAADLRIRFGVRVDARLFEALDMGGHRAWFDSVAAQGIDGVIFCHGELRDNTDAHADFSLAQRMVEVNFLSYVSLASQAAPYFCAKRAGFLCAVSSVAGDRGRRSNFVYGSSKAALSAYWDGLRGAVYPHGVRVVTIKPGFVDTAMTWGAANAPSVLVVSPEAAARDIIRAIRSGDDVAYAPNFWKFVMRVLGLIPERMFKRLPL